MKKMSLGIMDWDQYMVKTIQSGTGFIIDTNIDYSSYLNSENMEDIKRVFEIDGIYSYKFGISNQADDKGDLYKKSYTCKCHSLYGINNLNVLCHKCNTYVQRTIPHRYGWMDLGKYRVLNPLLIELLMETKRSVDESLIPSERGRRIRNGKMVKSKNDGKTQVSLFNLITKKKGINYTWDEILTNKGRLEDLLYEYFRNTSSWDIIKSMNGNYYVSKIMVLSSEYRPMKINTILSVPEISQDIINVQYMNISDCIHKLHSEPDTIRGISISFLVDIMQSLYEIYKQLYDAIGNGKRAMIRGEIFGRRVYNSARLVIEPIINRNIPEIDVIELPIDVFRGIFGADISKILDAYYPHVDNYTRSRLLDWDIKLTEEEKDFIRNDIFPKVQDPNNKFLREPCIYTTSVLAGRIVTLIDEMVLRIPFFILPAIAGDFDGDALAVINWENPEERRRIKEALTVTKSIIDTSNISYNTLIGPNNTTAVLLYEGFNKDAVIKKID